MIMTGCELCICSNYCPIVRIGAAVIEYETEREPMLSNSIKPPSE